MPREAPYGSWTSPISAALVATGGVRLGEVRASEGSLYRIELRPAEAGRIGAAVSEKTVAALAACRFQDLTGQRITKVVGTMKFVEERVDAMAELCGRDEVRALADEWDLPQQLDDGVPLEGPQRAGEGISQDDIDELFA